jgi:hypothetical protein
MSDKACQFVSGGQAAGGSSSVRTLADPPDSPVAAPSLCPQELREAELKIAELQQVPHLSKH